MDIKGYIKSKTTPIVGNWKIRKPLYDYWTPMSSEEPLVYNENGRPYNFYFMRDVHFAANPYKNTGKYFIWDRYAYGLKTHFYTHNAMLKTIGEPVIKYGMLVESRAIVPDDYNIFIRHKGLECDFDKIFSFDEEILNSISNAYFYPCWAAPWYMEKEKKLDENAYMGKEKDISFLSSDKVMCKMHKKRIKAAQECYKKNLADVFGRAIGEGYVELENVLKKYRFSIIIENDQREYYFTEKITNCFAAQTIPVYLGAKKIGDFFNTDGIISITEKDLDKLEDVLRQCTMNEYKRRLPAVLDNFQRVQEYRNMQDYLYEHYLQ